MISDQRSISQKQFAQKLSSSQNIAIDKGYMRNFQYEKEYEQAQLHNKQLFQADQDGSLAQVRRQMLESNLEVVFELISQLKFMKEGLSSAVREQQNKLKDYTQQMRRALFQLQIKLERETPQVKRISNRAQKQSLNQIKAVENSYSLQERNGSSLNDRIAQLSEQNRSLRQKCEGVIKQRKDQRRQRQKEIVKQNKSKQDKYSKQQEMESQLEQIQVLKAQNKQWRWKAKHYQLKLRQEQQTHAARILAFEEQIAEVEAQFESERINLAKLQQNLKQRQRQLEQSHRQMQVRGSHIQQQTVFLTNLEKSLESKEFELSRRQQKLNQFHCTLPLKNRQRSQLQRKSVHSEYFSGQLVSDYNQRFDKYGSTVRTGGKLYRKQSTECLQSRATAASRVNIQARLRQIAEEKRKNGNYQSRLSCSRQSERSSSKDSKFTSHQLYGNAKPAAQYQQMHRSSAYARPQPREFISTNQKLDHIIKSLHKDIDEIK